MTSCLDLNGGRNPASKSPGWPRERDYIGGHKYRSIIFMHPPNHAEEVFDVVLLTDQQATEPVRPSEQSLDLPSLAIATQRTAILCGLASAAAERRDQFDVVFPLEPSSSRSLSYRPATASSLSPCSFAPCLAKASCTLPGTNPAGFPEPRFWIASGLATNRPRPGSAQLGKARTREHGLVEPPEFKQQEAELFAGRLPPHADADCPLNC